MPMSCDTSPPITIRPIVALYSLLECNVNGTNLGNSTLVNIIESEFYIQDSSFYNFNVSRGRAILNAIKSKVVFKNVHFTTNQGQNGLIQILNGSSLHMELSSFEYNENKNNQTESIVLVKYDSNVYVTNCTFHGNKAHTGGSFYFCCGINVTIEDTVFTNNEALSGGAIFSQNHVNIVSLRNIFKGNLARARQDANKIMHRHSLYYNLGGAITFISDHSRNSLCEIHACIFLANEAFLKGGAIYFMFGNSYIFDSNFTWNNAGKYGGAIAVDGRSKITIINSNILKNKASMAGALSILNNVNVELSNVLFKGNVPSKGAPSIYASSYSVVAAFYCTFSDMNFGSKSIQISSEHNSTWTISNCKFLAEGQILFGILLSVSGGNIMFNNCTFQEVFRLFYITMNSNVSVSDSSIRNIEAFQDAMITLLDSCLSIDNTTITNIRQSTQYNTTSSVFITAFKSTVSIYGILYSRNNVTSFIEASQKTKIEITNAVSNYNEVTLENSNLLNIEKGEIILDDVVFENNTVIKPTGVLILVSDSTLNWYHSKVMKNRCLFAPAVMIQAEYTNMTISDNVFNNNDCLYILMVKSDTSAPTNYAQIINSRFFDNVGTVLFSSALSSKALNSTIQRAVLT